MEGIKRLNGGYGQTNLKTPSFRKTLKLRMQFVLCQKIDLNLGIKTEPVMSGADTTV